MKKEKEDVPLHYYERNVFLVLVFVVITVVLTYLTYKYYKEVNPLAFVIGVPALICGIQTLWLILNPFAVIYEDKFEIKRSLLSNKLWYFIDVQNVSDAGFKGFEIVYNDDEKESISTFGIRGSHKRKFRDMVNKYVCKSLVERD